MYFLGNIPKPGKREHNNPAKQPLNNKKNKRRLPVPGPNPLIPTTAPHPRPIPTLNPPPALQHLQITANPKALYRQHPNPIPIHRESQLSNSVGEN
jgi:hypothetical protein